MAAMKVIVELSTRLAELASIQDKTFGEQAEVDDVKARLAEAQDQWKAQNKGPRVIKRSVF